MRRAAVRAATPGSRDGHGGDAGGRGEPLEHRHERRRRDDRVAHPLGDVAQRVVVGDPRRPAAGAGSRGKNASETKRTTKTSGKMPCTVLALRARRASSMPRAAEADAGEDRRSRARDSTPSDAGLDRRRRRAARCTRNQSDLGDRERRRRASSRPKTIAARGMGAATSRSKKPPSISSAAAMPGGDAAEQQRLGDRRGELEVEEAVDLREAGQLGACACRPPTFTARNRRREDDERREELRAAQGVAQRAARQRERDAGHAGACSGFGSGSSAGAASAAAPSRCSPVFSTKTSSSVGS